MAVARDLHVESGLVSTSWEGILALVAVDGDEIVTLDRDDMALLTAVTGRHVELLRP